MEFNREEFWLPDFKTVEIPIAPAPAPGQYSSAEFNAEDLEYDYPVLLERVVVTEDTLITEVPDPGPGTSILPLLRMRWWQSKERAYGDLIPLHMLDDRRPRTSIVDAPIAGAGYGQLVWEPKNPVPLRVRNKDALVCDWENPNVAVGPAFPGGIIDLAAQGYLEQSRRPYVLHLPVTVLASGIGVAAPLVADTSSPTAGGRNRTGEDLIVQRLVAALDSVSYPQLAVDPRIWRHLRIMPRFRGKESERLAPYAERAPLSAWGDDVTVNNQAVTIPFNPWMPLDDKGTVMMEFRNYALVGTQVIATFCGWTKPQRDRPW